MAFWPASITCHLLVMLALVLLCSGQGPRVSISNGPMRGTYDSRNGVSVFRAIPYAEPLTRDKRFELPQKAQPWQGEFDATQIGNICYQFSSDLSLVPSALLAPQSEDCLNLDVYVPLDLRTRATRPSAALPVLVFVHGGGWIIGSRADTNGTFIAKRENIIVVSINYRLGLLGFMGLEDENIPGNVALYDQRLAFKWVKENIGAFGGNPNKVTIYGESAGSFCVNLHVLSPLSKGLFEGAIMSSGMHSTTLANRTQAAALVKGVASGLGCDVSSSVAILSCLRKLDAQTLQTAFNNVPTMPFVDGKFLREQPTDSLMCGRFNRVPVIAGYTSEDGLMLLAEFDDVAKKGLPQDQIPILTYAMLTLTLPGLTPEQHEIARNLTEAFYFSGDTSKPLVNLRPSLDFARGLFWSSPAIKMAKYLAKYDVPVYLYEFDERLETGVILGPPSEAAIELGSNHADDLFYVWGAVEDSAAFPQDSTPQKIQFSKDMTRTWADFVRTGKPSLRTINGQQLEWKPYTKEEPWYAVLKADVTSMKQNPEPKADMVWNRIMTAVEDRKPQCSKSDSSSGGMNWAWTYQWGPRWSWWTWWTRGQ